MQKTFLNKFGCLPIFALSLLSFTDQASANVMYNTYNQYATQSITDGDGDDGYTVSNYGEGEPVAWVGTEGGHLPFGLSYAELPFANWAVHLTGVGGSETVSSQNAHDLYGVWADMDTTQGAWADKIGQGTIYSMDLGLVKSDVTQQVTLNVSNTDASSWQNFGINVYSGDNGLHPKTVFAYTHDACCDADGKPVPIYEYVSTGYLSTMSHYGYWRPAVSTVSADNPFHSDGIDYLTHGEASTVTFTAQAGETYVILLGGNSGGDMYGSSESYAVEFASAPVPLPGGIWLFGSVLSLFIGSRARKSC